MANDLTKTTLLTRTAKAGEDLAAYRAVVIDSNGVATYPASSGDRADGFTARRAGVDEYVEVITDGVIPAQFGSPTGISAGDYVQANTVGKLIAGTSTNSASALVKEAPSDADDIKKVRVSDLINVEFA